MAADVPDTAVVDMPQGLTQPTVAAGARVVDIVEAAVTLAATVAVDTWAAAVVTWVEAAATVVAVTGNPESFHCKGVGLGSPLFLAQIKAIRRSAIC
jgi:hypothetical protein